MKRSITLAGILIFALVGVGTVVGLGTSSGGSKFKNQQGSLPQDPPGIVAEVIAPAPTESNLLAMASIEFHGAMMRGHKEQLSALMAESFKATMPDRAVLDRTQFLAVAKDTKLFYNASIGPARLSGDTAVLIGWIAPMRGKRETGLRIRFTDTWKKRGERWLLVSTIIRKNKSRHHRNRLTPRSSASLTN